MLWQQGLGEGPWYELDSNQVLRAQLSAEPSLPCAAVAQKLDGLEAVLQLRIRYLWGLRRPTLQAWWLLKLLVPLAVLGLEGC